MDETWATTNDLVAKARIRNAALELHATKGESNTTIREVAKAVGVSPGLVVHHFGNKEGLRKAVEQHVIDRFLHALNTIPTDGAAANVVAARDASVAALLAQNPILVNYLRRSVLDPSPVGPELLDRLMDFTLDQVRTLRAAGIGSDRTSETTQAISILVRQLGHLLLEPMLEHMWEYATDGRPSNDSPPAVEVTIRPRIIA
ncbi:MAG: TetR/AcrR family transcriptional regulator [Ferrimicrobium sp.]